MNTIIDIVNQSKHPIDSDEYIQYCNDEIKKNSILILNDFLTNDCLSELITEAHGLQDQAFYCSQNHTILLNKQDKLSDLNDPLNREVVSDKGCVPHDLLNQQSKLNILYQSNIFKNFLKGVLNLKDIYPYSDTLSSINYNYYQKSQQLGWHFDNASFAITLMIQSSDKGGEFEYVSKGRNFSENYIDKSYIKNILDRKILPQKADVDSGTLILFYGRNYLHRVTPVESEKPRILVTLNYNEEEGTMLSENARLTFFGRIN